MKPNKKALIPLLVIPLLVLSGVPANASTQITTFTVPFVYELSQNITIDPASPSATANFSLLYANPEKIVVEWDLNTTDTNGTVTVSLKAGDGTELKTVSLSASEPDATIPLAGTDVGDALTVELSGTNLEAVWQGTIKVIVYDPLNFDVSVSPSVVKVEKGGKSPIDISLTQNSGPGGQITFKVVFQKDGEPTNKLSATALTPVLSTTGAGWSGHTTMEIKADEDAPTGEYTGEITVYFTSGVSSELEGIEIAKITLTMTVGLSETQTETGWIPISGDHTIIYAGIIIVIVLVLIVALAGGRRGRRGFF